MSKSYQYYSLESMHMSWDPQGRVLHMWSDKPAMLKTHLASPFIAFMTRCVGDQQARMIVDAEYMLGMEAGFRNAAIVHFIGAGRHTELALFAAPRSMRLAVKMAMMVSRMHGEVFSTAAQACEWLCLDPGELARSRNSMKQTASA